MSRVTVGLTGGLASGKSTVAGWLEEAGCEVVDADRLVAELYAPGAEGARAVERLFGDGVLRPDGGVDHPALAERVFGDGGARRRLEAAIHPLVRRRFRDFAAGRKGIVVLEATLLVEAGHAPDFDRVVSVEADPAVRLERAVERGMDEAQARARMEAQGEGERRRGAAHRILRNDGDLADLRAAVDDLLTDLARLLAARGLLAGAALVTSNPGKLAESRRLAGVPLASVDLDLPEIQELEIERVARAKADEAWRRLERPLLVEETGLELDALNRFPGPLVKWMLQAAGADGIARTAHALGSTGATARCRLVYFDGERRAAGEGTVRGEIVHPPRGTGGFGWDPIFRPEGEARTYGEMGRAEKDRASHRALAWRALEEELGRG